MSDLGLLLVAHGTPQTLDDIPGFLANIRRGRPTPPAIIEEMKHRYSAIASPWPLLETTRAQAAQLSERTGLPAFVAMRMWNPLFEPTLRDLATQGLKRVIVLVMAPYSTHIYGDDLQQIASRLRAEGVPVPELQVAPCWATEPSYIEMWTALARQAISELDPKLAARSVLVPSAHSLPLRTIQAGDPYAELFVQTVDAVMRLLGNDALPHIVAFQSQGMSQEPWLGPDLPTVFQRAKDAGAKHVIVLPIGFVTDHLETLYDLDIEAKAIASELGLGFSRSSCPNLSEGLLDALETVVRRMLRAGEASV